MASRVVHCTAFCGVDRVASGDLATVVHQSKEVIDRGRRAVLIFDNTTSEQIEIDFRGTIDEVVARTNQSAHQLDPTDTEPAEAASPRTPGRPRLGVIAREVTLLPRHWDWLNSQPGGASVALRRLVDNARRINADTDRVRQSQEAAYRFMTAMGGDLPGFEEAIRALFAGKGADFQLQIAAWPLDIAEHARKLAATALDLPKELGESLKKPK